MQITTAYICFKEYLYLLEELFYFFNYASKNVQICVVQGHAVRMLG